MAATLATIGLQPNSLRWETFSRFRTHDKGSFYATMIGFSEPEPSGGVGAIPREVVTRVAP